jgi:hypothetical protein
VIQISCRLFEFMINFFSRQAQEEEEDEEEEEEDENAEEEETKLGTTAPAETLESDAARR